MSFHFRCPFCNAKLEAEDEWEGSETTCPKCTHEIGIEREPEFEPEPPAPPVNSSKQTQVIPESTSSVEKRARLLLNLYLPRLKVRLLLNLFQTMLYSHLFAQSVEPLLNWMVRLRAKNMNVRRVMKLLLPKERQRKNVPFVGKISI